MTYGKGNNPHAHLMLMARAVRTVGFRLKLRDADGVAFVSAGRETWASIANAALGKSGAGVEIDSRSNAARGIDTTPTRHQGPDPALRRARRWGKEMNHDLLEARRELLAEHGIRERFASLAARADWPPERRDPVPGSNDREAREWKTFWREVDKRLWGEELHPTREEASERVVQEARAPKQVGHVLQQLTEEIKRNAAVREATLEDALPVWRELHAAVVERMRADGFDTNHPLLDWTAMEKSLRDFDARLTELRLDEAQRRTDAPEPDPDGRPIHPREVEDAQARVLAEHARPASQMTSTPRPERMSATEREYTQAAIERQNAIEITDEGAQDHRLAPHESRLDWLDVQPVRETAGPVDLLEGRLDRLLPGKQDQTPDQLERSERDRER